MNKLRWKYFWIKFKSEWKPCKVCERKNDPCYENGCFKKKCTKMQI